MAESGLSLTLTEFRDAVGVFVFGTAYSSLDATKQGQVDQCVEAGFRQFYSPPRIGGEPSHNWSFLWITDTITHVAAYSTGTITVVDGVVTLASGTFPSNAASCVLTVSGNDYTVNTRDSGTQVTLDDLTVDVAAGTTYSLHQDDYDLADDFGHLVDETLTYNTSAYNTQKVLVVPESRIRSLRQQSTLGSGQYPFMAAVRAKENVAATGTRSEILFWPPVQSAAVVTFLYRARPPMVSTGTNYTYGVSDHAETIRLSCLAKAEEMFEQTEGVNTKRFREQLAASIDLDRRSNRGTFYGYNGDCSDGGYAFPRGMTVQNATYSNS